MKSFTNFKSAFNWVDDIVKKTTAKSIPDIAEEEYKDSRKYTYIDTEEMYQSGAMNSDFKKGLVIEKAPQVKWLYYTNWIKAGAGNRKAVPQWHEATKRENLNKYKGIYSKNFNEIKKG